MKTKALLTTLTLLGFAVFAVAAEVAYREPTKPYKDSAFLKDAKAQPVDLGRGTMRVPIITWAADGVTVSANGGLAANPNSALARAVKMPVQLELVDDFDEQVKNYIAGKTPFLRGTVGMIALAAEALTNIDRGLEPVVIVQLSWSTGADGFVAKDIKSLADLKGKTIVVQQNGPHVDLVQVLLQDAGLKPGEVNLKFVRDITVNPKAPKDGKVHDPANALRNDPSLTGAACIFPDILTLTAGGTVGTGAEDSVKGARPILTTRTASRVIADVYAVRRDFFQAQKALVQSFVAAHLAEQQRFKDALANIAKKTQADAAKVAEFKKLSKPLAGIFLQDEGAVNDYIVWVGVDSELASLAGNTEFFTSANNPVGFDATQTRVLAYYEQTGLVTKPQKLAPAGWNFESDFGPKIKVEAERKTFASAADVRRAADSKDASKLFSYTFKFPAKMAEIRWQDYREVFETMHEKVTRYGGAIVQLRGHADNFFYNFVQMKRAKGESTYQRRIEGSTQFETLPLPTTEEVANSANKLSYSRAFAVKQAYAQYLREALGKTQDEMDLSRFDVKGMGVSDPVVKSPTTPEQREANMRGEMFVIAVEAEVPVDFGADDLK
jgi:ABC-type nitrate/sulfonate/bicarbonate transport system substrate-binding protein